MEKIYLNSEEYETAVEAYREKYGYEDMSEQEKADFDTRLDKVIGKKAEEGDWTADQRSDSDLLRDQLKERYGYEDMSDEQKRIFDEKLDKVVGPETSDDEEDPDQHHKVLRLR